MKIAWLLAATLVLVVWTAECFADGGRRDVSPAMRMSIRLVGDAQPISGELVAWSDERLWLREQGREVEREVLWMHVPPAQAYDIARRLIDAKSADRWVWLGLTMLDAGDPSLAKRAFDVGARLQPDLTPRVSEALRMHRAGEDPRGAFRAAPVEEKPTESDGAASKENPGRRGVAPDPRAKGRVGPQWKALTPEQQEKHLEQVRSACAGYLAQAGLKIEPVETEHFVFYSELARSETMRWAGELDKMYHTLIRTLEIPEGTRMFQGKGAIIVFRERDTFIKFEKAAFGLDATMFGGVNHSRDGYTFTVFYKAPDLQKFNSILIHETVHAFMYRYRSPVGLPTWANEGLADYIAGHLVHYSDEPMKHWHHTRNFVAQKGNPMDVMRLSYLDGSWPNDDAYPVSHMLVRFMLKNKPRDFKLWIDDIKDGKDWREALRQRFGVTAEVLASGFAADIMRERGYSRVN